MRSIRPGDRGPAVEDVQRRLRVLGYDLGPTGIDGVFQGRTLAAVESFQVEHGLDEDGLVGDQTWAALVDATFKLGDRMLYLRLPHLHGRDVRELQDALNALGFAAGDSDAIFGACTERAVREFQRNTGLPADGIAGDDTLRALINLRHAWEGKDGGPYSASRKGPVRAGAVLAQNTVAIVATDDFATDVAGRLVNLAFATTDEARIVTLGDGHAAPAESAVVLVLSSAPPLADQPGRPSVRMGELDAAAQARLATAIQAARTGDHSVVVQLDEVGDDAERDGQRAAVAVLDALCAALG